MLLLVAGRLFAASWPAALLLAVELMLNYFRV